jgi:hypothetical protein
MRIPIHPKVTLLEAMSMASQYGADLEHKFDTGRPSAMEVPDRLEDQPRPVVQMDARRLPWTGPITPDDGPFGGDAA